MDPQLFTTLLHEAGPRWLAIFGVGLWFWRVTPWVGKQAEKVIDHYVGGGNGWMIRGPLDKQPK
jgi:hypothetical protein